MAVNSASVASAVTGNPDSGPGITNASTNPGRRPLGSGTKSSPGGTAPSSADVASAVTQGKPPTGKGVPQPKLPKLPKLSPTMLGPGPIPHPGVSPPYPDARSRPLTLMPNGTPVMPPPPGFPLAGAIPRVPPTFAPHTGPMIPSGRPGMSGLLGR